MPRPNVRRMPVSTYEEILLAVSLVQSESSYPVFYRRPVVAALNFDLGFTRWQMNYQKYLETGAQLQGYWEHFPHGSGEYRLTEKGRREAQSILGRHAEPWYRSLEKDDSVFALEGFVGSKRVQLRYVIDKGIPVIDGRLQKCTEAYRFLLPDLQRRPRNRFNREMRPDVALWDMAVELGFTIKWAPAVILPAHPSRRA